MNNILAHSAVQKYPASQQSYGYHSPRHGCSTETLNSLGHFFLTKHTEGSLTLEFAFLVGSNSPKLFSFLACLFPLYFSESEK